jgi:hypothetical protein
MLAMSDMLYNKANQLTEIRNKLKCAAKQEKHRSTNQSNPTTKPVGDSIGQKRSDHSTSLQRRDNIGR